MRASVASITKKFISTFFAATLALGLVPAAAFAVEDVESTPASTDAATTESIADDGTASDLVSKETTDEPVVGEGSATNTAIPAGEIINQTQPLEVVAKAESTRSYFLAQTLESTRTVPMVSANLPLDTAVVDDPVVPAEGDGEAAGEGAEDSDESDQGGVIAAESIVVGSFEYRGITYAVEPGGESVAVVAADYAKLSKESIEAHAIVLPSAVTVNGAEFYSVARVVDGAFASLARIDSAMGSPIYSSTHALTADDADVDFAFRAVSDVAGEEVSTGEDAIVETDGAITVVAVPSSVETIETGAFADFDSLRWIVVSTENPNYSSYDGALYDAAKTSLLLIPEGRTGAVRIAPSATSIDPEVFSHCPSDIVLVADADGAALTSADGFLYEKDLSKLDFPMPVAIADGDEVIVSAVGLDEGLLVSDSYDEATLDELIASEQEALDSHIAETAERAAFVKTTTVDQPLQNIDSSATSQADSQQDVLEATIIDPSALSVDEEVFVSAAETSPRVYTTPEGISAYSITARLTPAASLSDETGGTLCTGTWSNGVGSALIPDDEPYANWRLIGMTLYIFCEPGHVISNEGNPFSSWSVWSASEKIDAWYPVRSMVSKVVMQEGLETETMVGWFKHMYSLTDVSQVFIPKGCKNVESLFRNCTSLASLPDGFTIPYGVTQCSCLFYGCTSLKTLPQGFSVPGSATSALCVFYQCVSLEALNSDFSLSRNEAGTADEEGAPCDYRQVFLSCRSLKALPYGFNIPTNATAVTLMFRDCDSLVSLPSTLDFSNYPAGGSWTSVFDDAGASFNDHAVYNPKVVTRVVGDLGKLMPPGAKLTDDQKAMVGAGKQYATEVQCYWGENYGRDLQKTTRTDAEAEVRFTVPDGSGGWNVVETVHATAQGLVNEPSRPEGFDDYVFGGWFCESEYKNRYKFNEPVSWQTATNGVSHVAVDTVKEGSGENERTIYLIRAQLVGPIVNCTVPVRTQIDIDLFNLNNGSDLVTDAGDIQFYSTRTYKEGKVAVTGAFVTAGKGGFEMFPDESDRSSIRLLLDLGHGKSDQFESLLDQPSDISMAYENLTGLTARLAGDGTPESPATLDGQIRLKIPSGVTPPENNRTYDEAVRMLWMVKVIPD